MKPIFYYNETWKLNYQFYIGWTAKDFESYIIKHYDKDYYIPSSACGTMIKLMKKDNITLQCFIIWSELKTDYGTIAHECLHATNRTLHRAGWSPELDNDEPQTYLMTILINKALGR